MGKPTVRRLQSLSMAEKTARSIYRAQLGRVEMTADMSACKKPVWISCFFDGTGNNYKEDGNGSLNVYETKYSNVAKLGKFAHEENDPANRTYALYVPGVGTPFPEVGDSGGGLDKATGMANAAKGQARLDYMMKEFKKRIDLHMPHVNQVNVAVFGFSRGAAEARAFVHQLGAICARQDADLLWTHSGGDVPRVVIYFVGIFDTVASVGYGGSRLESSLKWVVGPVWGGILYSMDEVGHAAWANDLRIPSYVRFCEHYVAAHEVREKFPSDSVRQDQAINSNCRETFYPGAHSDVGGGYESMTQEGRSNELSRIPLCNMYLSAYAAGVPLKSPEEIVKDCGGLFTIGEELQSCFEAYMRVIEEGERLEPQVISHMGAYYHWRWGRTERQRAERKQREALIAKGQSVVYATPDTYMTTTDKEWEADVQQIAEKRTGFFRSSTTPLEDVIFDAWIGTLRKKMGPANCALFDKFFDRYVHDSIAGFKNQMSDSHIGFVEASRWSRNRQYFMGKREKKFLYWRYEGERPLTQGTNEAMLTPTTQAAGHAIA